jgi:hypothetical protein
MIEQRRLDAPPAAARLQHPEHHDAVDAGCPIFGCGEIPAKVRPQPERREIPMETSKMFHESDAALPEAC